MNVIRRKPSKRLKSLPIRLAPGQNRGQAAEIATCQVADGLMTLEGFIRQTGIHEQDGNGPFLRLMYMLRPELTLH